MYSSIFLQKKNNNWPHDNKSQWVIQLSWSYNDDDDRRYILWCFYALKTNEMKGLMSFIAFYGNQKQKVRNNEVKI